MTEQTPIQPPPETPTQTAALDAPAAGGMSRWAARAKAAARPQPDIVPPSTAPVATTEGAPQAGLAAEPAEPAEPIAAAATGNASRRFFSRPAPEDRQADGPTGANPFMPAADGAAAARSGEERGALEDAGLGHVAGPTDPPVAPTPLNPALAIPSSWPIGPAHPFNAVQLVGLHGGAGTSTMAALLGPVALDCGTSLANLTTLEIPVLFVTRTHAHGLDLALRLGQQYAARALDQVMVLGLVVVRDAPTLSKGLARTLRSVEKTLPNCWTVPWSEDLRHDPEMPSPADHGRMARDVRRIVKKAEQLRDRHAGLQHPSAQAT